MLEVKSLRGEVKLFGGGGGGGGGEVSPRPPSRYNPASLYIWLITRVSVKYDEIFHQ